MTSFAAVTSFAAELATPTVTDVRMDTLLRLIYKDVLHCDEFQTLPHGNMSRRKMPFATVMHTLQ